MLSELVQPLTLDIVKKIRMVANFPQLHQHVLVLLFVSIAKPNPACCQQKLLVEFYLKISKIDADIDFYFIGKLCL